MEDVRKIVFQSFERGQRQKRREIFNVLRHEMDRSRSTEVLESAAGKPARQSEGLVQNVLRIWNRLRIRNGNLKRRAAVGIAGRKSHGALVEKKPNLGHPNGDDGDNGYLNAQIGYGLGYLLVARAEIRPLRVPMNE
jgi:hypothetical protein